MNSAAIPGPSMGEWLDRIKDLSILRALSELDIYHLDETSLLRSALKLWLDEFGISAGTVQFFRQGQWHEGATLSWDEQRHYLLRPLGDMPYYGELSSACANVTRTRAPMHCHIEHPAFTGSALAFPMLLSEQGLVGFLGILCAAPFKFDIQHERLGILFANFLTQITQSMRLLRQMENEVALRMETNDLLMRETLELKQKFERLSFIDELTQLYNRRFFFQEAQRALRQDIDRRQPFTVLLLDMDYFKRINDLFGHAAGDATLKCVSTYLQSRVRQSDILSRFGGEEFVLALPGTTRDGALRVAENLLSGIRSLSCTYEDVEIRDITLSIGVACSDDIGDRKDDLEYLFQNADKALYAAKQAGRDRVCMYDGKDVDCP